jgi:ankyrin repeat protein
MGRTPLMLAAFRGKVEVVHYLVQMEAEINV